MIRPPVFRRLVSLGADDFAVHRVLAKTRAMKMPTS